FRFWNAHRIRDLQTKVVRRLTLDEVSGLQVTNSLDSVRNIWSVDAGRKKAVYGTVYESRDPDEFRTPAGSIRTFRVWSENVVAPDPFLVRRRSTMGSGTDYPNDQWDDEETHTYVVQFLINGKWIQKESGTQGVSGVDIRCMYTDTGELLLRVANGHPYPVRFARREDNIPSLRIGGVVVEDFPNNVITEEDQESSAKYGPRNLKLSGDWVQERLRISEVDEFLKSRTVEPIPTTDAITIAGDPRLQMGDTIEIKDPEGMGETLRVQILGISRTFSRDGGLEDVLTVELVRPSGVGIWDSE